MTISSQYTALAPAEGPWTALAERSNNIFSTWEWAAVWWNHFGAGRSLRIGVLHDPSGDPVAVLPLYSERRARLRLTRLIGHTVADQLGPVCGPAELDQAQAALREAGGGLLLAERLPAELDWARLGGRVLHSELSPVIDLSAGAGWEDYLSAHSANFRQQVRRRQRRLTTTRGIRFRLTQDPGRLAEDMNTLIALHRARWGSASRAFSGAREAFHREFATLALERGWLRLWIAEAEAGPVGAWYGFRYGDVEYFYQSGRDPAWDESGIGAGLLEHSIREAFAEGALEYRLLRGGERYKLRYATEVRRVVTVAVPLSHSGRGATVVAGSLARSARGRALLRGAV